MILKRATVPPAELVHQLIAAMQAPPDVAVTAAVADPIPDVYPLPPSSPEVSRRPPQVTPLKGRPSFCSVFCGHAI